MIPPPPTPAPADCPVCGSLPASYLAQTGYGDPLPEASRRLVAMELDNRHDVWRCPHCEALFHYEEMSQLFGSGNLDEERLDRLNEGQAAAVRQLLAPGFGGLAPEQLVRLASRTLPNPLFHVLLAHLAYHTTTLGPLVPSLAELLAATGDQPLVTVLLSWCGQKRERLELVIGQLDRDGRPLSRFGEVLRRLARERLAGLGASM